MTTVYKNLGFLGFPYHQIGTDGSVWTRRKASHIVKNWIRKTPEPSRKGGHLRITLTHNNTRKRYFVHQLMLSAFVGPRPPGMICRHFPDRDVTNNRLENLSWSTHLQNQKDRLVHNTASRGESHACSKINETIVKKIRELYASGETGTQIASKFKLSFGHVYQIIAKKAWKHV